MINIYSFEKGLRIEPVASVSADRLGEIEVTNAGTLHIYDGTTTQEFTTLTQTQTITNKTIVPANNIISLANAYILVGNGTKAVGVAVSGDVTIDNTGAISIGASKVTNTMLSGSIDVSKLAPLNISKAVQTDASGFIEASSVTTTELGYVSGVTSSIQTQLNTKAFIDSTALSITKTGTWQITPAYQITPSLNIDINGSITKYSGKCIDSFSYSESASISNKVTSLTFTDLQGVALSFSLVSLTALTTLNMSALAYVGSNFSLSTSMPVLTTLNISGLAYIGGSFNIIGPGLTSLNVSSLAYVGGDIYPSTMALTTLSFPALVRCGGNFGPSTMSSLTSLTSNTLVTVGADYYPNSTDLLTTLSATSLTTVGGAFHPNTMGALTTLSFNALTLVVGDFHPYNMPILTTLSATSLVTVQQFLPDSMSALTTISMPALTTILVDCIFSNMAALTTISLPAMLTYGRSITANTGLGNLTTITLGTPGTGAGNIKSIGGNISITGQKLNVATVNGILALLVSLNGSNGTTLWGSGKSVLLNGGTSAAPTGQGITDKATLIARGATVTTN